MENNGTERTVVEIRQSLKQAATALSPHVKRIAAAWSKMLNRYESCRKHAPVLILLHPANRLREAGATNAREYREETERQGVDFASRGVPPECCAVAISLFVECCLPYLTTDDPQSMRWRRALYRWASVYQFFLLTGYSQCEAEDRQAMQEKVDLADRRCQDFSAQLGDAYEAERRRLAQDLHDEIGHDLIVLKLYTQTMS